MEKLSKIGSYELLAEPFHCDFSHHLFMGHLGNHLLNAADFHSNDRGYGMTFLNPIHRTWVLSRLAIEMNEMPEAYDRFTVDTWVDAVMRYFTSRVKMTETASLVQSIATHYSDVDMNGHINSVKYIEHVLNLWPLEWYRHHFLKRFEIAYVAESHCGDTLNLYQEETGEGEFCVRITKRSNATAEETEVVRSKVKFIKE